jgi:hypothetical protein
MGSTKNGTSPNISWLNGISWVHKKRHALELSGSSNSGTSSNVPVFRSSGISFNILRFRGSSNFSNILGFRRSGTFSNDPGFKSSDIIF